ncbi:MAG TPA: hypothetical protein DCM67_04255 [Propionibacteriaceae bacterium]|nr:hypothetical protein [Propionibacteriaceae bacterium]
MSTTVAEELAAEPEVPSQQGSLAAWILLLVGLSIVVGALAGVFWSGVVTLPSYQIQPDGSAVIGEQGLSQIVAADVWFSITGALVGAGLGLVVWKWFHPLGWPTSLLAVAAGLLAGLACWRFGTLLGPGPFEARMAAAQAGDLVPVSLELQAWSALAIWAFAAVTPVLLISSLGPDDEEVALDSGRGDQAEPEEHAEVDEIGVLTTDET